MRISRRMVFVYMAVVVCITCGNPCYLFSQSLSDVEMKEMADENKGKWRSIEQGMDMGKVRSLLGAPGRVTYGAMVSWYYELGSVVHFKDSKVDSWTEPVSFEYIPSGAITGDIADEGDSTY